MGAEVTIDKHSTSIQEWLDVQDKLQSTSFELQVNSHLVAWKFFADQVNPQQYNSLPVDLDLNAVHQLLSPHQTYLILAIKKQNQNRGRTNLSAIANLINSIKQNIDEQTYSSPIIQGSIDGFGYRVYAYLGKLSKPKIRLVALSYALKAQNLLNSKKKLAILSNGCVLRNKKLQKGSTLTLLGNIPEIQKEISDYQMMHIFNFYWGQTSKKSKLLNYKSNRSSPFIVCEQIVTKIVGIKPPLLKLSLKPFQQVKYQQIEQQQKNGEIKFDIRATARHELKMQKFESECSEILDGIYLSGEKIAKTWQSLQKNKIKAVINCAGDYCQNWFENKGITYLTFFLKDSQNENIECLFYRSIDFIQNCQKNKTNVLIHCIQGISRSVTMVLAYIIFKMGYDYKKAEQFVKQKRGIACPNNGFMVELIQFHKRLYEDYNSLPIPRVFLVSAHCKETPNIITARMIKQQLFDKKKFIGLDSRAIYIIQAPDIVYIWVGSKCQEKRLQDYWSYSQQYVKKLQKYERASIKIKAISQGTEGKQFYGLWNMQDSPSMYQNAEYNRLFCEGQNTKPGGMRKFYQRQIQQQNQSKLYIYPEFQNGLGVFQFQDLGNLSLLVCVLDDSLKIFIYKGEGFNEDEELIGEFLENVIKTNYTSFDSDKINIQEESHQNPSESFLSYFS